jgi:hypothetical protein
MLSGNCESRSFIQLMIQSIRSNVPVAGEETID